MKRLSHNEVYKCFKSNDCELLEKGYSNNRTKMQYRCKCGNISEIDFSNFQKGQRCSKCAGNKKLSYEDVFQLFQQNKCELLEDKYSNSVTKMKYRCSCGNISGTTLGNFKKGKRCMKCSGNEKFSFKYVFDFFKNKGCELLENGYKEANTKMRYSCNCGNIDKIRFRAFKRGDSCHNCAIEKRAGVNHYNYNPNLTDKERRKNQSRTSDFLCKEWRIEVFERDKFICQKCFQKGKYLNAHHIKNWADNIESRYVLPNGISLCMDCHNEFHSIYGYKNTNEEQISEFVTNLLIGD